MGRVNGRARCFALVIHAALLPTWRQPRGRIFLTTKTVKQLQSSTGARLGTSRWFGVTQAMIDAFADVTEDHQFIHTDPMRAAQTPFGGTIAHGYLTLSMLSAMSYDAQPDIAGQVMGVNYGLNHLRFLSPVPAGASIRAHFTLNAVEERKPGEITLTWGVEVEIRDHPKPALVAEWLQRRYLDPHHHEKRPQGCDE